MFKSKMLNDSYKIPKFLTKVLLNLQVQEIPADFLIFRLNLERDLESLISFGNVYHKRQPLYSIFSSPYVVDYDQRSW